MIHVYAFAERLEALPDVRGVTGAVVERLQVEDVTAVFSRGADRTSRETLRRDALAHGAVIDAVRERAVAVVPVRFGEAVADDGELTESIGGRLGKLRRTFDRVRDCAEIAVRIYVGEEQLEQRASSGTDYMRRHASAEARRREAAESLHRELADVAADSRADSGIRMRRECLSVSYLVPSERVDELRTAVERFANAHPALTVVCTGPWAPFSFVEEAW